MPLTQVYQSVKSSVVQVHALNSTVSVSSGSGSIIGNGRHVLTCAHCVTAGAQMAIANPMQANHALFANVIFSDAQKDIALLELPSPIGPPATLENSSSCAIGNGVFVVGFPMGITDQVLLSAYIASITPTSIRLDASVNHGNSGGPLFNLAGRQIGVINAKHGSLSDFLTQVKNARPGASMSIGGLDPVKIIQQLITEMEINLNLGIGYAIPTAIIKLLHPILNATIT